MDRGNDQNRGQRDQSQDCRKEGVALARLQPVTRHDQRADGANGARLVNRRDARDDRPEHQENQCQRRDQDQQHLADEGTVHLALEGHRRGGPGAQQREAKDERHVKPNQHQARQHRAQEHLACTGRDDTEFRGHAELASGLLEELGPRSPSLINGARQLVGEDDQHDRGRNDLSQRARGGDGAGGQRLGIIVTQHRWQRDQPHGDHGRADDTRRGRKKRAHEDDRDPEAPRDRAEKLGHGDQQVLGNLRALEHDAHKDEERDRDQGVAFRLPIDPAEIGYPGAQPLDSAALGEIGIGIAREKVAADRCKHDRQDRGAGQGEGDRVARAERDDHQDDQDGEEEKFHGAVAFPLKTLLSPHGTNAGRAGRRARPANRPRTRTCS